MHVVVVGCGRVGAQLSTRLVEQGHSVAVVDKNAKAFNRLPEDFGGKRIVGFGFDRDRLSEAGIDEANALAAVTSGDNSNIVVARIAKETYAIERVVARIYDPRRAEIYQRLGINTVATVAWTTDQAMRRIMPDQTGSEYIEPTGKVAVVEREVPSVAVGRPLDEVDEPGQFRVVALTRNGEATVPAKGLVMQEGDILLVAMAADAGEAFHERLTAQKEH